MPGSLAASSEPAAEQAAQSALADGGGCIDALIAGFFGAAGAHAGVLLSPAVAMVAGVGVGPRCLDGRSLQPGLGIRRPRGILPGEDAPGGAWVAVPRTVAMMTLLHAYGAHLPFGTLVRPGVAGAKKLGASRRATLLEGVQRQGASALRTADPQRRLLRIGGPAAGGLLTESDLQQAMPGDATVRWAPLDAELRYACPPWQDSPPPGTAGADECAANEPAARRAEVIVAADQRGVAGVLSYCPEQATGLELPDLELELPRDAAPVRRGVPRVTPGTPRPTSCPIALLHRPQEGWFAVVGLSAAPEIEPAVLAAPQTSLQHRLEAVATACAATDGLAASVQRGRTATYRASG